MEQTILSFCREYGLLRHGERVAVAVSGGADSMALLAVLLRLRETLGIEVSAAHFHHGLRGAEADRDLAFVRDWCREQGIACAEGRGDVRAYAAETGQSEETAARSLRYAFLESLPVDKIATAHNANDNLETVLEHLLRGAGIRGFAGIPPQRGRLVRPMLRCTHAEAERYLALQGIPHVEDSTNAADGCLRNRLRRKVTPLLLEENPDLLRTVARSCAIVRAEDDFLSAQAREAETACREAGGWSCTRLLSLAPILRRRVLLGLLRTLPMENPTQAAVDALEQLLTAGPSASRVLPGGWEAWREYGLLCLGERRRVLCCPERELIIPGTTLLPELGMKILANVTESSNISQKNLNTFALRYDMIAQERCCVRARRTGDTLRLPGGARSVKRLMIDRRIPAHARSACPVVLCGTQVAAVLGLAVDSAFLPLPGAAVLELTLLPLTEKSNLKEKPLEQ